MFKELGRFFHKAPRKPADKSVEPTGQVSRRDFLGKAGLFTAAAVVAPSVLLEGCGPNAAPATAPTTGSSAAVRPPSETPFAPAPATRDTTSDTIPVRSGAPKEPIAQQPAPTAAEKPTAVKTEPSPTAVKKEPTPTSVPQKSKEETEAERKKEMIDRVEGVINNIKNPPPDLMQKYNIAPDDIQDDNNNLIYGAEPNSVKQTTGKEFLPDKSLLGVKVYIEQGDNKKALQVLNAIFEFARNGTSKGKTIPKVETLPVKEIDPQGIQYKYATTQPDAKVPYPAHRGQAMISMVHLMYDLQGIPFKLKE